ncbi:hypothetical protein P7C71_g664, partial [Lecanoromycetidae sp. Uapishka_2]
MAAMRKKTLQCIIDHVYLPPKLPQAAEDTELRAQNAAIILRKTDEEMIFECFEASAQAKAVLEAKGSVIRRFPAHAVAIPLTTFDDHNFQRELAYRLSQLDTEAIAEMIPYMQKAGSRTGVIRDTANPALVTEMLMAILAPLGRLVNIRRVRKRVRDDVLWDECLRPWRRSPFWMCLRVVLQTTLHTFLTDDEASIQYKNFIIFALTEVASRASASKIPSDVCHIMIAKIARRTSKLGQNNLAFVQERALRVCRAIRTEQDETWTALQRDDADSQTALPKKIDKKQFERDTALSLNASKFYLSGVLGHGDRARRTQSAYTPQCQNWLDWSTRGLPSLVQQTSTEKIVYGLTQLEDWVMESLPTWMERMLLALPSHTSIARDCTALAKLAIDYRNQAAEVYSMAPEQTSTMLLVIGEVWHVLDILAVKILPLLAEYSPALPLNLFDPLLLPRRAQMQRLQEIELHIAARISQAKLMNPSIFSGPDENAFAVRYYATSVSHQALKERIEEVASEKREEKRREWEQKAAEYRRLKHEADSKVCDDGITANGQECHDPETCEKCTLISEIESIVIEVHEWPLPEVHTASASAIVELHCPLEFAAWRNVTWMLLQDCGRSGRFAGARPAITLSNYAGLRDHALDRHSRLTLASTVNPFGQAHNGRLPFPVELDLCLKDNALCYKLFDPTGNIWISDSDKAPNLHALCVTMLPPGPYANLQFAVDSVLHSQNQVIASQDTCSKSLKLHEFVSFGSLRADGERVQWLNIKRELTASNLTFDNEAVCTLITQAAWQAGTGAETFRRNTHIDLAVPASCEELLNTIQKIFTSIKANWKSDNAMLLITMVILRILSLSADPKVVETSLDLLQEIRSAVHKWTENLWTTFPSVVESDQLLRLQQRLLKICALCKLTYDVDAEYRSRVLNTVDDVKIWTLCSIHIRENLPGDETKLPPDIRRLILRDMKVSYNLYLRVRRMIVEDNNNGLDLAIRQVWSSFQPGSASWKLLEAPNDRWLSSDIEVAPAYSVQNLLYNVLDGELLIDGRPLGRLPTEYIRSDLYQKTFGAHTLLVGSADLPGMLYKSRQEFMGYFVYFDIGANSASNIFV